MQFTPTHCRAARLLLNWKQDHLEKKAKVSIISIRRFEGDHDVSDRIKTKLKTALEKAGAVFFYPGDPIDDTKADVGVVLRKKNDKRLPEE